MKKDPPSIFHALHQKVTYYYHSPKDAHVTSPIPPHVTQTRAEGEEKTEGVSYVETYQEDPGICTFNPPGGLESVPWYKTGHFRPPEALSQSTWVQLSPHRKPCFNLPGYHFHRPDVFPRGRHISTWCFQ